MLHFPDSKQLFTYYIHQLICYMRKLCEKLWFIQNILKAMSYRLGTVYYKRQTTVCYVYIYIYMYMYIHQYTN